MDLSGISLKNLKAELYRRKTAETFLRFNTMPTSVIEFSIKDSIDQKSGAYIYLANVNDGCEGFSFLIQSKIELVNDELEKIVKSHSLKSLLTDGLIDPDSYSIEGIEIEEIGRSSLEFIQVD